MKRGMSVLMRPLLALLLLLTAWSARAQYDIDQFFFRGQRALMEGQYTQAINNFNIIIRLDGSVPDAEIEKLIDLSYELTQPFRRRV